MADIASLLVAMLKWYCDAERALNDLMARVGWERRYYAQKGQDKWLVNEVFPGKFSGYFVEVGGGDGRSHSNTYILEKRHGWHGVVIEPNQTLAKRVKQHRSCQCYNGCVDDKFGTVKFFNYGYLGGIIDDDTDYSIDKRSHLLKKRADLIAEINAKPLPAVLDEVGAPKNIDYLSIDVEGAEHRVLAGMPRSAYRFKAITIERPSQEVHTMLCDLGYVLAKQRMFDGFYLDAEFARGIGLSETVYRLTPKKAF